MGERGGVHTFRPTYTEPDGNGGRRKRKGKSWCWRFSYHGHPYQGCGDKRSGLPFKTRSEAREAGEARKAEVVAGYESDPRKTTFLTLKTIAEADAELQGTSTEKAMKVAWKRLAAYFPAGELAMDIGRRTRLIQYIKHAKAAGYQPNTINFDLCQLKRAFRLAHDEGRLLGVPRFPTLPTEPRGVYFQPHEFEAVLSKLPSWWVNFFRAADEMGWRARSELRRRCWTDVDLEGGWVQLEASSDKNRKGRLFPITQHLRSILQEQRDWVSAIEEATGSIIPFIFCRPDGKPLGDYQKPWVRACAAAGFGRLEGRKGPWSSARVVHDVRRTTLRRWDRLQGAPLGARMNAAGHTSPQTHLDYVGQDPEALKRLGELLDQARGVKTNLVPFRKAGSEEP